MMSETLFGGAERTPDKTGQPQRPLWEAMRRGFSGRCPHCGEGHLFSSFLKSVECCPACGEEMHHHRADDLPAYLVIAVVGHVVVGAFMAVEAATTWPMWLYLAIWIPATVLMSLLLLQPTKGAVIGLQWALYMHGFNGDHEEAETHPEL